MNILDAASMAGVTLKKVASTKGGEYAGACPGCGGSDRFRVWPADKGGGGSWWCRGCGKGGDLVQFLVDFNGYAYKDAFAAAGRSMPQDYRPARYRPANAIREPDFEPRQYEIPVEAWQVKATDFIDNAHQALLGYDHALKYLDSRGLDLAAVKAFRLGWFAGENGRNCMFRPRTSWGLSKIKNEKTGKDKMLWIPRGIVIPCYKKDRVYRIRIRRPKIDLQQASDIKYYVLPGSGMEVMDINSEKKTLVVVEAELDAMLIARFAGSLAGAVALGSAQNKPGSSVYYDLKKALRILVALDYDTAGQSAWKFWAENFPNAKLWPVPDGKDPGEAFEKGVDIKDWIRHGLPPAALLDEPGPGLDEIDIPDGLYPMQELKFLLSRFPIEIKADPDHAEVIFAPGFNQPAIRQRVNDLFYGDEEIHWYLRSFHPDTIIHGGNCEVKKTG